MYKQHSPTHTARTFASSRLSAGVVVMFALFAAACSESATGVTAPALQPELQLSASNSLFAAPAHFTVLANAAVSCKNGTIIGDVGTFLATPTGSVTQSTCPINGKIHVGDAAAKQAFNDFLSRYAALAPKPRDVCTTLTGTLAGRTLAPGAYCFDAAAVLTGVLTLKGTSTGLYTFKIGTSGTGALTTTNFSMVMAGGAQACNVTWWIAQAATMTDSKFVGTLLAGTAATMTRGTFTGNVYSKAGVTITGTAVAACTSSTSSTGRGGRSH
jgi:hypothetical protein